MTYTAIDPSGASWEINSIDAKAFAVCARDRKGWSVFRWVTSRTDAVRGALVAREKGFTDVRTVEVERVA